MSQYSDYGFQSSQAEHTAAYLHDPLIQLLTKDAVILDLGCGNGALVNKLITLGYNAYGSDASASGIEIANKVNPGRFAIQDLSSDELPENFSNLKFTTIISTEVVEHLYAPRKFVGFAKHILLRNGGGNFILSTPYHGYFKNLTIALAGKWDTHADPLWDGGHIKLWSKKTLTTLLNEQGFKVSAFRGCGRLPYLWKSMILKSSIVS